MEGVFMRLLLFCMLFTGASVVSGQEGRMKKEFRPVAIAGDIDRPEGMAVLGNSLFISQYHENGSIVSYDLVNRTVSGKVTGGLKYPTGLLALENRLIVLEYGTGSMYRVDPEKGEKELMVTGFARPADVILYGKDLLVSDFGRGTIYRVDPESHEMSVFASGLSTPAGMAVLNENVHVVEWGMGRISRILEDGTKEVVVAEDLSSPWGLMVYEDELYVSENGSHEISRITGVRIPVKDRSPAGQPETVDAFQDSITVWKVVSMNAKGLDHPEAFCASERGIYVSEWKSKEVSEIRLNSPPSGELLLTGKSKLGHEVTAEPQDIKDEDGLGPFTYHWQIADFPEADQWEDIDGNKVVYKLKKESWAGKYIRAMLTYTDQKGVDEFVVSDARLITEPLAPEVSLSLYPEHVLLPGDTVTLTAELEVLDEDAVPDKVEFYSDGVQLLSVPTPPYKYRFVVQDQNTGEGFLEQLSIVAKGYDSNGLTDKDERTVFVTNERSSEAELLSWLESAGEEPRFFPNPATEVIHVISNSQEPIKVRLFDMERRVVMSSAIVRGIRTLDISRLPQGTYIMEYTFGDETRAEKILKL